MGISFEKRLDEVKISLERQVLMIGRQGFDVHLFASLKKDLEWLQEEARKPSTAKFHLNR
jgi:hypothetical protein